MKILHTTRLKTTSHQEAFDLVTTHLFTQGVQAKNGMMCVNLTRSGLMCAGGALMKHPGRVNQAIKTAVLDGKVKTKLLPEFLDSLRAVHDNYLNWDVVNHQFVGGNALRSVAERYWLDSSIVDAFDR